MFNIKRKASKFKAITKFNVISTHLREISKNFREKWCFHQIWKCFRIWCCLLMAYQQKDTNIGDMMMHSCGI